MTIKNETNKNNIREQEQQKEMIYKKWFDKLSGCGNCSSSSFVSLAGNRALTLLGGHFWALYTAQNKKRENKLIRQQFRSGFETPM